MEKQYKVWLFYVAKQATLKHDFEIIEKRDPNWMLGRSGVDKEFETLAFKYHWKHLKIQPFDEFMANTGIYGYEWFLDIMKNEPPKKFKISGEFKKAA